jgi:hypothetical protein
LEGFDRGIPDNMQLVMLEHWKWLKRKDWGRPLDWSWRGVQIVEDLVEDLHIRGVYSIWDAQIPKKRNEIPSLVFYTLISSSFRKKMRT